MAVDKDFYAIIINHTPAENLQEMYEQIAYKHEFNDGRLSAVGYEEDDEAEKLRYCEEECVGLDYCGGSKEDGSDCPQAPSKEAVSRIWKEANTCDKDFRYCNGDGCKFTYCINNLNI